MASGPRLVYKARISPPFELFMLRLRCLVSFLLLLAATARSVEPASRAPSRAVAPPEVLHLTMQSAIRMALAKNFSIEAQRFEPRIARQGVKVEQGRFDPRWDLTGEAGEGRQRGLLDLARRTPFSANRTQSLSTGVGGLAPWGMTYDLSQGITGLDGTGQAFGKEYLSNWRVGLMQPLLKGFGPTANLAQVRIARSNVLVSEWELRKRIIDTITTTNFVFNELHFAHENLRTAERSRGLAEQLLADNRKRAEIGVMSPLNITTARAEAAARQENVILARRQVKDNENLLKQLVTNDLERMLSMAVEIEPPPTPGFKPDVPVGITQALELRPDYRQALLEIQKRQITLAYTQNQALPRFDLTGSLNLLGLDHDIGQSVGRLPNRDQFQWSIGAIFSVPIPNREGQASVASAKLSAAQALIQLQQLEQQIVVDVDNASGQIVTSNERIVSTSEARALALESLAAGEERLRAGAGTTFEVLELQKKLAEAESAELRARSDYNKSVSEYQRQTGTALKVHNVVVK
jgi:outer membrane protein